MTCSCGKPLGEDLFWREVLTQASFDAATLAEMRQLEASVCRSGFLAQNRFSQQAISANPGVQRFLDLQFRLYEAIAGTSDSAVLVDSSKAGPRAWLLACDPRVRILHIYRDPADVIASWRSTKFDPGMGQAMKRLPVSAAALDWWKVEQLVRQLARVHPVSGMDYRAFCADPQHVLAVLLRELRLDGDVCPNWTASDKITERDSYHSLNGNPDRFARGSIRITARAVDWAKVRAAERPIIRAAAGALRLFYPPHG